MSRDPALASIRSTVPGIEWPPLSVGPAGVLAALIQQHDASQWLPADEIAAQQRAQLRVLVAHFERHSAPFRERLAAARLSAADVATTDGFAALPVLSRTELQARGESIFVSDLPPGHAPVARNATSGSTGEPVVVARTAINQLDWLALTMREHLWHGADFETRLCAIRANIDAVAEREDWGPPASLLFGTGRSLGIPITVDVARQLELIERFAPSNLLVYPTILDALTRLVAERGIRIPSLSRIRTVGETLRPSVREAAAEAFSAHVVDAYSSQEVGYIAIECPDGEGYHAMAETLIVEVLDARGGPCAPGETGRITVTDLHNFATPIVRYDIGDYAEVGSPCPCGRGLPTLAKVLGRERNLIAMPDGTRHWPLVGYAGFRAIAPVKQYQFVQVAPTRIDVTLAVQRALTSVEEAKLIGHIQQTLGYPFELHLSYVSGPLPRGPAGKFEEFVCRVGR